MSILHGKSYIVQNWARKSFYSIF